MNWKTANNRKRRGPYALRFQRLWPGFRLVWKRFEDKPFAQREAA